MKRILSIVLLFVLSYMAGAQGTYPVSANIQLAPPYTVYLSDLVSPVKDKLFVSLLFNDVNDPAIDVRLRFTIEGVGITIQNTPEFRPPAPIRLQSGTLERLDAALLAPYFDANNLIFQGYTRQQYQRSAALPEGFYKITVQAYEYTTGVLISNKAVYSAWIMLNDPPRIITPTCGDKIRLLNPQNIVFQWAPMHMASPDPGEETEYYFKMVQVQPAGRNPNDAILSSVPVFEFTTANSSFLYGADDPLLIPGQEYAWRVQATYKNGKSMFKNDGYSQVCWFTYGDPCTAPADIKAVVQNAQRVNIGWSPLSAADGYTIRYKEKNNTQANWYENQVTTTGGLITGISTNKTYEYQVLSICGSYESPWSVSDTFRTMSTPDVGQCGMQVVIPQDTTGELLPDLRANDVVTVDGFKVRIITASGGDGIFEGSGVAFIPFLSAYVKMTFASITVSKGYIVTQGRMVAVKSNKVAIYKGQVEPRVYRDICTGGGNNSTGTNRNNTTQPSGQNGSSTGNQQNDTVRVITINGTTEVRTGDTITVNGQQVIVDKNTVIKKGDVVVVNGTTIKVNTVTQRTIISGAIAGSLASSLDSTLSVVIQYIKTDLNNVDDLIQQATQKLSAARDVIKSNEEIPVLEGGEGDGVSVGAVSVEIRGEGMGLLPYFQERQSNTAYKQYSEAADSVIYYAIMKKVKENNGEAILDSYLQDPLTTQLKSEVTASLQTLSAVQLESFTHDRRLFQAYIRSYVEKKIGAQIGIEALTITE